MQFQDLSPDQMQKTLKLCDLLSLEDFTVAAAILASYDWSIQKAFDSMQIQTSKTNNQGNNVPKIENQYDYDMAGAQDEQNLFQEEERNEYEYNLNSQIERNKKMFQQEYASLLPLQKSISEPSKELSKLQYHKQLAQNYSQHRHQYVTTLLKKSQSICKHILVGNEENRRKYDENQRKIQNNRRFIAYLYKNFHSRINFTFGTFFLNLTRSYLDNKFLLVYIHNSSQQQKECNKVVQLLLNQHQTAKFVNQNCITYGMFDNSDDYQIVQKYVPLKQLPAFALFSLNKATKTQNFLAYFKISNQNLVFLEWLATSIGVSLKKKQATHINKQKQAILKAEQQKKSQQIKNLKQNEKKKTYIEHHYIVEQQNKLYEEMEKMALQKKKLSLDKKQTIKNHEQELQFRRKKADQLKQPDFGQGVIEIRFRMPVNGDSKSRRFLHQDKVFQMFNYVDCYCRDQFQQKFNQFDLRQTFPSLSLMDKKQKTIGQVFEDSGKQNIIIREL